MTDGKPSLTVDVPDMSIENTLEELLYRCATNLLECFALKDLRMFISIRAAHFSRGNLVLLDSYVPLDLQKFFKKLKFTLSPSSFPVVLMKLHSQFSWPYPVSHIASKSTRQAEIPEMAPNDATDSWSLCSSSAVGTEIIGDTSTLDGWVLESSSNNKGG
jgi:hypothetical protein